MPRVINLDALVVETVTVNLKMPDGSTKTYDLKDDVPVEVGMLAFKLMQKEQDIQASEASGSTSKFDAQAQRLEMMADDVTHILGEIWRHTYPETTDAELAALIPPAQGMAIMQVFFTSLTARFNAPGSATDSVPSQEQQGRSNLPAPDPLSAEIPSPKPLSSEPSDQE